MSEPKQYVVTAYRWGLRDNHSYVVGVYDSIEAAKYEAEAHVGWRGGKYGCEVMECVTNWPHDSEADMNRPKRVAYFESPYFGLACRNVPSYQPADSAKPPIKHQHATRLEEVFRLELEIAELKRKARE